ncbi:hypothetical protein SRIMHP_38040 [Streptomyces rimosus subsp. rimosus]|uniref:Uncharacterized protein n=1 Tax=Streptomyces rimosus subsp. rimosus TaxID=132474 RepID=A0ABY3YTN4_STRRM|nr:hypothetical protein SRIMR7_01610 [Streptomyces rimosus subsp. rimosus]UTH92815.1 hypothetical protein SRIMHP_01610 [Streptomyces rimosus subsp. rimosus]UTH99942.1 hypothetical protein SRIMHP_38040 [Streptomyces rimosus subsp. rimosus]UTJ10931.1 hypothetical protein SRIMDV3_01610 [Streptomyces rimosus subsp. rimosus]UTJ18038.1 hypothetical protein SRIMDV3_37935 [Streptomyces rimosus subsp. rimosus]
MDPMDRTGKRGNHLLSTRPAVMAAVPTVSRVRVTITASDPISREGVVSQLRRHPEVDLCADPGSASVAVLVVGTIRENELLDVIECGAGAIV